VANKDFPAIYSKLPVLREQTHCTRTSCRDLQGRIFDYVNEGQWEDKKQWSLGVGQRRKAFIYKCAIYSETRKCKLSFAKRSLGNAEFSHQYTHMPAGVSVLFSTLENGGSFFIRRNQGMCGGFGMLRIFKIVKY
jgi:hypothetical protein